MLRGERHLLQGQLLRGMVKTLRLQPLPVTRSPGLLAWVYPAVS
jgi:hypothetical protein